MRPMPLRQRLIAKPPLNAIAAVIVMAAIGIVLKPVLPTKAGSLDEPRTAVKQLQATAGARIEQRQKQTQQIRAENYDLEQVPINGKNEYHWRHLLWTTAVVEPREAFVAKALNEILSLSIRPGLTDVQIRIVDQAMKVGTQLYLSDPDFYGSIGQRFVETIEQSRDPEWVAAALSGLFAGKLSSSELMRLSALVKTRFANWQTNVYLQTTLQDIDYANQPQPLPPLKDLLAWDIAPQQLQLYVLCRRDRRVLCQAILKDREGQFVRQGDGLWSVPLLLESIHRLSWNFTRGQTPQGIFRIEGTVPQPDQKFFRAYGQFPLINLYVPFEAGAKQFLPNQAGKFSGQLADYEALLPPSWRTYYPMQQSFWAGKAGRGLFRIHGSGEAVDFFQGKDKVLVDSYDWNPTIGCLSARELYDEKGQLMQADMPKILQTLQQVGGKNFTGYLIVVDIPADDPQPVSMKEIEALVQQLHAKARPGQRLAQKAGHATVQGPVARSLESSASNLSRKPQVNQPVPPVPPSIELKPLPIAY